jgi:prophage DNA circulation protein
MSEALTSIAGLASALPWVGANLRPGALRGLLFYVQTSEETSTRRWVTHEFPGRDEAWHEDLGQKTRSFSVEGVLVGPDVVLQSRAFARAAADPEPATLLHPWLGAMRVVVLDCRISHDVNQARVARVSLRVEKAGTKPAPTFGIDSLGEVLDEADRLLTAAQSIYAEYRFMRAAADFIVQSFYASVTGIAGAIESTLSSVGLVGGAAGSVAALSTMSDAALVSDTAVPLALAAATRDVSSLAGGRAALDDGTDAAPQAAFAALGILAEQDLVAAPEAAPATPARKQLADAQGGLALLAQVMIAGEFARAAAAVPWASRDEAMAARDRVSDALANAADAAAAAGWNAVWQRLVALRAAMAADLAARAAPLPRLRRLELPDVMPATLIAYRLDGDSLSDVFGRGAALAARNRVRHPGFVPAGSPIEVLA